eukprot:tig00001694_g9574.t1
MEDGESVVVIHPGSRFLRIGLANQLLPLELPHCIARRRYDGKPMHELYEKETALSEKETHAREREWKKTEEELESIRQAAAAQAAGAAAAQPTGGRKRARTAQKVASSAAEVRHARAVAPCPPRVAEAGDDPTWWTPTALPGRKAPPFFVGHDALQIADEDAYELHWPMRGGFFNVGQASGNADPADELQRVLDDLQEIWTFALLQIKARPFRDPHPASREISHRATPVFPHLRAVLAVPDSFERREVKELMGLLLVRLGFAGALVQQEAVCACYGVGLSTACVVDLGHEKTSVAVVDEGAVAPAARLHMPYGGADLARLMLWLWRSPALNPAYPWDAPDFDLARPLDALALDRVKEAVATVGSQREAAEYSLTLRRRGRPTRTVTGKVGHPVTAVGVAYFHPALLEPLPARGPATYSETDAFPDDPSLPAPAAAEAAPALVGPKGHLLPGVRQARGGAPAFDPQAPLPLDEAIAAAVCRYDKAERRKVLFQNILLVGGGARLAGLAGEVEERVLQRIPSHEEAETVSVVAPTAERAPQTTVWRGAAIAARLEGAAEAFVPVSNFRYWGDRALRERALFPF